jgi:hypothetical protein
MDKNIKDRMMLTLTTGILLLLGVVIVGDYIIAVIADRPLDGEIITLMKMSITGLIGIIAGYFGGKD